MTYTIKAATEYGIGNGPNGTGRRQKITGYFGISPEGRKVIAFTSKNAKAEAEAWMNDRNEWLRKRAS